MTMVRAWLLAEIEALAGDLAAEIRRNEQTVLARRANDWTDNHLQATKLEATAGSHGQVVLPDGLEVPDAPPHPDSTGEAGIRSKPLDYQRGVFQLAAQLRVGLILLRELGRDDVAQVEESHTAARHTADLLPGAGVCPCGKSVPGGRTRNQRLTNVEGHWLCYSHVTGRYKPAWRDQPIDAYVNHIRTDQQPRAQVCIRCEGEGTINWPPEACPACDGTGTLLGEAS